MTTTGKFVSVLALVAVCYGAHWVAAESTATISDPDGYTNVRDSARGKVIAVVKNGERFLAAEPYETSKDRNWWRVYLKSGTSGWMERSRIQLLPNEPLMKLNYNPRKKDWLELPSKPVTENDEEAWQAKEQGVDYYKTIVRASEGDEEALAKFYSLSSTMDGAAVEKYRPDAWALFHIVGDEKFAAMLSKQSAKFRKDMRELFSDSEITTDPISKPKPYIKGYFPKSYKILFAANRSQD